MVLRFISSLCVVAIVVVVVVDDASIVVCGSVIVSCVAIVVWLCWCV